MSWAKGTAERKTKYIEQRIRTKIKSVDMFNH